MKLESTLKINVTDLKQVLLNSGNDYSINDIKNDLRSFGATVDGEKVNDQVYMYISGDIDIEDIEAAFDEAGVDVNDFIVDDVLSECDDIDLDKCDEDDLGECEEDLDECGIPEYDEVNDCDSYNNECYEKKGDCCPPKRKTINESTKISDIRKIRKNKNVPKNILVPLKEALYNKNIKRTTREDIPSLNNIIDNIVGKRNSKNVNEAAINKAKAERIKSRVNENLEFLKDKLGEKLYNQVCEAIVSGKKSLHENITINKKKLIDYSLDELKSIYEKITSQINNLKSKVGEGLNETDAANIQQQLTTKERLSQILVEEIEYRQAIMEEEEKDSALVDKNLDPNKESGDKTDDNTSDEEDTDNEENPDEDEEEDVASIVITLASKSAAEDMKSDLIDEGVPEDVIEIAPVEDTEEETDGENEEESKDDKEESSEEETSEEKTEESVNVKGAHKINEDEEETKDEEKSEDDAEEKSEDEESDEDKEEGSYKLVLTDTDYAKTLRDVLGTKWGLSEEEFNDMIGGEIVSDDSEETSDEEEKSEDSEDTEGDSNDDFDPDELFKDI